MGQKGIASSRAGGGQFGAYYGEGDEMKQHGNEFHEPDFSEMGHVHVGIGYTLPVQALTSSPADGATVYFGQLPKAPVTTAATSKLRVPKSGTIKRVFVYCYSGTAGTAEAWSLYVRLNNLTDTLIKTLSVSQAERIFDNDALNIAVVAGDYIEIKGVQPAWATNPLTTVYGGYVYVE